MIVNCPAALGKTMDRYCTGTGWVGSIRSVAEGLRLILQTSLDGHHRPNSNVRCVLHSFCYIIRVVVVYPLSEFCLACMWAVAKAATMHQNECIMLFNFTFPVVVNVQSYIALHCMQRDPTYK
jgi:hypothetical protein